MIKAAVIGTQHPATPRLLSLLTHHPDVTLTAVVDAANSGRHLTDIVPTLIGDADTDLRVTADTSVISEADVIFLALAPGEARKFINRADISPDLKIIDLTGDFGTPDETHDFVEGIAELNRKAMVRGALHVTIPDPVTQAVALTLLPLAKNLLLNQPIRATYFTTDPSAKYGTLTVDSAANAENIAERVLRAVGTLQNNTGATLDVKGFVGNLPSSTLVTVTIAIPGIDMAHARQAFEQFYDDHNFICSPDNGRPIDASDVRHTNKAIYSLRADRNGSYTITLAFDPDLKGSAGNAVHCMNLLFGLHERVGL